MGSSAITKNPPSVFAKHRVFRTVLPVGSVAALGLLMHEHRPDLQFEDEALGQSDTGMETLVAVRLRILDVVLETPHDRVKRRVDGAKSAVTVSTRRDDDSEGEEIVDLGQLEAFQAHLPPNPRRILGSVLKKQIWNIPMLQNGTEFAVETLCPGVNRRSQRLQLLIQRLERLGSEDA
jgi:hypothetical protein